MSEVGQHDTPDALDAYIGARLREQRTAHGFSLLKAGEIIGLSQQQMSRLERGEARVLAAHIYRLARAYSAPVSYFYNGYIEAETELQRLRNVLGKKVVEWQALALDERESQVLDAYRRLPEELRQPLDEFLLVLRRRGVRT